MRHALFSVTVQENFFNILETVEHAFVQGLDTLVFHVHFSFGNAVGFAHADDLVRRQGARTHAALMTATVHLRFKTHTRLAADIQGTNALGSVSLV